MITGGTVRLFLEYLALNRFAFDVVDVQFFKLKYETKGFGVKTSLRIVFGIPIISLIFLQESIL